MIRNSNFQSLIYAGTITTGDDFNNYQSPGVYRYNGTPQHHPGIANDYGIASVMVTGSYIIQQAYSGTEQRWKHRHMVTGGASWTDWATDATKSDLADYLKVSHLQLDVTLKSGAVDTYSIPLIVPDGYKTFSIVDAYSSGYSFMVANRYLDGSVIKVNVRNVSPTETTNTIHVHVLCVKS